MADTMMEQRVTQLEKLVAEVWNAFAETDQRLAELSKETWRQIEETQRQMEKTQRQMAEHTANTDRQIAETQRQMAEHTANTDRQIAETQRQMAEQKAETDQHLAELDKKTWRQIDEIRQAAKQFSQNTDKRSKELAETIQELRRKWGELSNRLGTLAEDLVSPSVPRILRDVVNCPEDKVSMMAVRVRRHHTADYGRTREFDVVAVCGDYVLINETKSKLDAEGIRDFVTLMAEARDFFPEYESYHFIGAIAALQMDESIARYGERQGLIVLGLSDGLMEVLNEPQFTPKSF
jgi:hypothetical protein